MKLFVASETSPLERSVIVVARVVALLAPWGKKCDVQELIKGLLPLFVNSFVLAISYK